MPVTLVATAADALTHAEVAVKAEYLEGGGHSDLQILVNNEHGTQALQVGLLSAWVGQFCLLSLHPLLILQICANVCELPGVCQLAGGVLVVELCAADKSPHLQHQ